MKFDNLKNIKPKNITVANADENYANYLCALPETKPKKQVWSVVGTIAAAVAIVLAVSLWAIIGRGIRGTKTPDEEKFLWPASESIEITENMQTEFERMYGEYSLHSFPHFEKGTLPAKEEIIEFVDYEPDAYRAESGKFSDMYNAFVLEWFGVIPDYEVNENARKGRVIHTDYLPPTLLTFTRSYSDDGTQIITLTFGDTVRWEATLSYVAISNFEPDYFIKHTIERKNTAVNKVTVTVPEESEYKAGEYTIAGDDADTLISAIKSRPRTKDQIAADGMIRLNTADWSCSLHIGDDTCHINIEDGGIHLSSDDEIVKIVKKYLEPIEKTEIVVLQKNDINSKSSNEYTLSGDDAKELLQILSTKTTEGNCICMPTHSVSYDGKTYNITIGDTTHSHFTSDGKKHVFDIDEYKKITALFERCITQDNFTGTKKIDTEIRWTGKIEVSANVVYDRLQGGE